MQIWAQVLLAGLPYALLVVGAAFRLESRVSRLEGKVDALLVMVGDRQVPAGRISE